MSWEIFGVGKHECDGFCFGYAEGVKDGVCVGDGSYEFVVDCNNPNNTKVCAPEWDLGVGSVSHSGKMEAVVLFKKAHPCRGVISEIKFTEVNVFLEGAVVWAG